MAEPKDDRLWGGRFERAPDALFDEFQNSFACDCRLLPYEIAVDRAWAKALERAEILTAEELEATLRALDRVAERSARDPLWLASSAAEDVHHFVEKSLREELGPLAWKLHTGRSRNELVAADFRLFVRDAARELAGLIRALAGALVSQAKAYLHVPLAGMTHLQHAQPLLLSHFLLSHAQAFQRDVRRVNAAAASADACPLGSGALAGCAFPVDRDLIARELGFSRITRNSIDAVGDRDFALDYLFALAGIATHLSRLAEDFVLFASEEFSYLVLPEEYATGSSLMPQKKNPDSWELLRGKTGRILGALVGLFTTLKGLPTGYQRDLQEDKETLFAASDEVEQMLRVAAGALSASTFREDRLLSAAQNPSLRATEAADYLVRHGVPFRRAHELVGQLLREAERRGRAWTELSLAELQKVAPEFGPDLFEEASLEKAIARKAVPGGTAESAVRAQITELEQELGEGGNQP